jgi:hypothetical protein
MASTNFLSSYYLFIMVVSVLAAALTINWIAVHRSTSLMALLWGLLPFVFLWIGTYLSLKALKCPPPTTCEYVGLGHVVILFILTGAAMVYLPLAYFMRLVLRRLIWKGPSPAHDTRSEVKSGLILIAGAFGGFIVASLITVLIYSGLFVAWQAIEMPIDPTPRAGVPPEVAKLPTGTSEHAKTILLAFQNEVFILTDQDRVLSGKLTRQGNEISKKDMTWQIETGPPITQFRSYQRGCALQFLVLPPPGRVVDRVQSRQCDSSDLYQAEYAILADGSLWAWRSHVPLYSFLIPAVLLGPAVGFSLALALAFRSEYGSQRHGANPG